MNACWFFYDARHYDQAIEHCLKAIDLDRDFHPAWRTLGLAYAQKGQLDEAVAALEEAQARSTWMEPYLGYVYALAGRRQEARRMLDEHRSDPAWGPRKLAVIQAGLGEWDEVLGQPERGYAERQPFLNALKVDPMWDPIRTHPRFQALLKKMGLE